MTRVHLVRHAAHALVGRVLAGRMAGVSLSSEGLDQAQRLADVLATRNIGRILSSPLERCLQTAAPLAERLALDVSVEPRLNELDCGDWTGLPFEALERDSRWQAWNSGREGAHVPGGETIGAVRHRVMDLLGELGANDQGPAVLITHSDVIKVAILALLRASSDLHDRLEIDPASVTTLDLWPGGGKLLRSNEAMR